MAKTKTQIRAQVRDINNRLTTDADSVIDHFIDISTELFNNVISSIFDLQIWRHTFNQSDLDNDVDNWVLPDNIKNIQKVTYVDNSSTNKHFIPLDRISHSEIYDLIKKGALSGPGTSFLSLGQKDYSGSKASFSGRFTTGGVRIGRVDTESTPRVYAQLGSLIYIFPRPTSDDLNNELRLTLQTRTNSLVNDSDTNTITTRFPEAFAMYVAALISLLHQRDPVNGPLWLQQAGVMLQAYATADEISRLTNFTFNHSRV